MDNKILKILMVSFMIWAIASTSALAYYYSLYNDLNSEYAQLKNRVAEYQGVISDMEAVISDLRSSLRNMNSTYQELFKNYSEMLQEFSRLLEGGYVNMVIDFGNGTRLFYKFYVVIGENNTVFHLLLATGLSLDYDEYPEFNDVFINCIGGVCGQMTGDNSGMYWMLYINTQLSSAGARQSKVFGGDLVEWRYEEISW